MITGLPAASASAAGNYGTIQFSLASSLALDNAMESGGGGPTNNVSYVSLRKWDATAQLNDITVAEVSAGGRLAGTIIYRV